MKVERIEVGELTFDVGVEGSCGDPLVLLLHGFPQTRHTWRYALPALGEAGFHAVAPDQRGYSPGARPPNVEDYATEHLTADALDLADALGAERFHLVGHDWGGQLAWCIAAMSPDRVRSLCVLSRPHPAAFVRAMSDDPDQPNRSRHHRAFQSPDATDRMLADGAKALRAALTSQGVPEADVDAYLTPLSDHAALDAAIHWYRAAGGAGLRASDVPHVRVPTRYVWGDADATVGPKAAHATRDYVTGPYRFDVIEGAGHFLTDQAPERTTRAIVEHVKENP